MSGIAIPTAENDRGGAFPFQRWYAHATVRDALHTLTWLIAAAFTAAALLALAFQTHPTYTINIGDAPQDAAVVHNFNLPERQASEDGGHRFRWTRGTGALVFPGIGRGAVAVDLVLAGAASPVRDTRVSANQHEVATLHLTTAFQHYHLVVPASLMSDGTLVLTLASTPFSPQRDPRILGAAVEQATLQPLGHPVAVPPMRIAASLWLAAVAVALALLAAGLPGVGVWAGSTIVALAMASLLVTNRLFLTVDASGVLRAGILMLAIAVLIRFLFPWLAHRLGLAFTAKEVRWLAVIASSVLAVRFAGVLHPDIVIIDLKFHLHRLADVADSHRLLLPIQSAEFGDRTVLYAPTPYLVLLPFTVLIHDRVLLLVLSALGIDAIRFCIIWIVARQVSEDVVAANLTVLTMALMPVGWIVYEWGAFANIVAEGMLTLFFALLVLGYHRLTAPCPWRWCIIFAATICLTMLAHLGVLVLTGATTVLYLLARTAEFIRSVKLSRGNCDRMAKRQAMGRATRFAIAGLSAAVVAFALFYRFPAHDLLTHQRRQSVEQETMNPPPLPVPHQYRTGGATPDDRIGLPRITTAHLSTALVLEAWEDGYAFYRVWPGVTCLVGVVLLYRSAMSRVAPQRVDDERSQRGWYARVWRPFGRAATPDSVTGAAALTIVVWLLVAATMLVVGIVTRLYVRYPLYALPAVAFGSGIALAWLVRHARWGWLVAVVVLGFSGVTTLLVWYDRIVYAMKRPI